MIGFGTSRRLAAIALLLALAVASSCSEKITSAGEQRIDLEIWTSLAASGQAAQASRFVLTVTGPGIMEPVVAELDLAGGLLTGSVVVPAGPDRVFRIDAYDEAGTLLYSGQTITDVLGGSELRLDIELVPRVPMIKLSPVYLETIQGDLLAMKISVYNIPDAGALHVLLASYRSVGESYLDTGPGNALIDAAICHFSEGKKSFDEGGLLARQGKVYDELLGSLVKHPYFQKQPPKSLDKETFGKAFFAKLIKDNPGLTSANTVATMTQFTVRTIEMGIIEFLLQNDISYEEIIVSGGGARNIAIVESLRHYFPKLSLNAADDYPIMGRAKEAALYAFLANETIMGNPGNLPSATGAKAPTILGSITPGLTAL